MCHVDKVRLVHHLIHKTIGLELAANNKHALATRSLLQMAPARLVDNANSLTSKEHSA